MKGAFIVKIKLKTLQKICEVCTAKELDFLLYTLRFQDKHGVVKGLTYKDVCSAIDINKSKFYDILTSLENKEIINVDWEKEYHGFWNYRLKNNTFWDDDDLKEGYININTAFLQDRKFLKLKQAEKIISLNLLARYRHGKKSFSFTLETLMKWTGKSLQSVKKYAKSLQNIFKTLLVTDKSIIFDFNKNETAFLRTATYENDTYNEHIVDYIVSVKKADSDNESRKSVAQMFTQYKKYGRDVVNTAILYCIEMHKKLIPPYINTMISTIAIKNMPLTLF